jgi:hypothetical protein
MINMKYSIVVIFIILSIPVLAQKDSTAKPSLEPQSMAISGGIGVSTISLVVPVNSGVAEGNPISIGPAYNFMLDYNSIRKFSAGIAIAYQQLSYVPGDNQGYSQNAFIDNASRLNIGIRYLMHFSKVSYSDVYIGIRMGVSYWRDNESLNPNYHSSSPYVSAPIPASPWTKTKASVQLLVGYKVYSLDNIGMQIEAGLGTPYYAEAGLTYRIHTRQ